MSLGLDIERRYVGLLSCIAVAICGLAMAAASASAAPPKCHGKKATIWFKGDTPKTVEGTGGPDVIVTGKGGDTINGNGNRDVICSHGGNDTIDGGSGLDRVYSGSGDDVIEGANGDDVLCAYGGNDVTFGGNGSDWISVGTGINYYDADGTDPEEDGMVDKWREDGYTYTVGVGSGEDDVMTGGMIHVKGAKLDKRWRC